MNNLILTIDDAVEVALDNIRNNYNCDVDEEDEQILYQDMEQKAYINNDSEDSLMRLTGLILDVNPAEICSQIESDNLKQWCQILQVNMQMALITLKQNNETAEWLDAERSDVPYGLIVKCSRCGTETLINDALEHKYCSECGARMV